jgi:hypothetical protein
LTTPPSPRKIENNIYRRRILYDYNKFVKKVIGKTDCVYMKYPISNIKHLTSRRAGACDLSYYARTLMQGQPAIKSNSVPLKTTGVNLTIIYIIINPFLTIAVYNLRENKGRRIFRVGGEPWIRRKSLS